MCSTTRVRPAERDLRTAAEREVEQHEQGAARAPRRESRDPPPQKRHQHDRQQLGRDRQDECDRRQRGTPAGQPVRGRRDPQRAERVDVPAVRDFQHDQRIPRIRERQPLAPSRRRAAIARRPGWSAGRTRPAPASSRARSRAGSRPAGRTAAPPAGYGVFCRALGICRVSSVWVQASSGSAGRTR